MGCSDAWEVQLTPEEARERRREDERRERCTREAREISLARLTVGDLLELVGVFRPSYPYHTWSTRDTDTLERIIRKGKRG